jgi:hypothetical protein
MSARESAAGDEVFLAHPCIAVASAARPSLWSAPFVPAAPWFASLGDDCFGPRSTRSGRRCDDDLVGPLCRGLDALGWRTVTARSVAAAIADPDRLHARGRDPRRPPPRLPRGIARCCARPSGTAACRSSPSATDAIPAGRRFGRYGHVRTAASGPGRVADRTPDALRHRRRGIQPASGDLRRCRARP